MLVEIDSGALVRDRYLVGENGLGSYVLRDDLAGGRILTESIRDHDVLRDRPREKSGHEYPCGPYFGKAISRRIVRAITDVRAFAKVML